MGIFEYDEEKLLEMERNEAEQRAEERFGQLLAKLLNDGRSKEIQQITTDKEFRDKLYKEYNLL